MEVNQSNHQAQAVPNRRILVKRSKRQQKQKSRNSKVNVVDFELECEGWKYADISLSECSDDADCAGQEPKGYYQSGGYYPVRIGETFNNGRYRVLRKLGWGMKSTVWLCQEIPTENYVALKIMQSNECSSSIAKDEIKLLLRVQTADFEDERKTKTIQLLNQFTIHGPHGKHVCMVLEIWGPDLYDVIQTNKEGLPILQVKFIVKQILEALDYLHSKCKMKHGNINPRNIVTSVKPSYVKELAKDAEIMVKSGEKLSNSIVIHAPRKYPKIVTEAELMKTGKLSKIEKKAKQLGESDPSKTDNHGHSRNEMEDSEFSDEDLDDDLERVPITDLKIKFRDKNWHDKYTTVACNQPPHRYRSPEMQLGHAVDESTDIWSLACIAFELATGNYLFDPVPVQPIKACCDCQAVAEEHLAAIMSLLGKIPKKMRLGGPKSPEFFDMKRGNLKHVKAHDPCSLFDTLTCKYKMEDQDAQEFCEFLLPMLKYDQDKRATASDCLNHEWIHSFELEEEDKAEALKPSESETIIQSGIVKKDCISTPVEGSDRDVYTSLMLTSSLNPSPDELQVQTVDDKPGQCGCADTESVLKLALNHPNTNWWSWFFGYLRYFSEKVFKTFWG